jgi:hypothetical protein
MIDFFDVHKGKAIIDVIVSSKDTLCSKKSNEKGSAYEEAFR